MAYSEPDFQVSRPAKTLSKVPFRGNQSQRCTRYWNHPKPNRLDRITAGIDAGNGLCDLCRHSGSALHSNALRRDQSSHRCRFRPELETTLLQIVCSTNSATEIPWLKKWLDSPSISMTKRSPSRKGYFSVGVSLPCSTGEPQPTLRSN